MTVAPALVISLDFELHWGVYDLWSVAEYRANLLGARTAVPAMLALFAEHGIHATWATVGGLCCEDRRELLEVAPPRLGPCLARAGVGEDERDDPFHFAPSLVRRIADTPHQEVGTHTFSHYCCLEAGGSPADFRDDLQAAVQVMLRRLGTRPRSIVFPRNQGHAACLAVCREFGLVAYRGNPRGWLHAARPRHAESPVRRAVRLADAYLPLAGTMAYRPVDLPDAPVANVPASRYLRPWSPRLRPLERLRRHRITADLEHAARHGLTYHLWWHPHDFGAHLAENLALLRHLLRRFIFLRETYGMESLTMAEAAARLVAAMPAVSAAS